MRIPRCGFLAVVLCAGSGVSGTVAQDGPDLTTRFSTSTGWTSNAGGNVFEEESLFATQTGEVSARVQADGLVLRGSISGTQTRYLNADYANDRGAEANVTLDSQLGPDTALRGSITYGIDEIGSAFEFFGIGIRTMSVAQQLDVDLTIAQSWDRLEVAVDLGHTRVTNGESVFVDLPIAPQRLDPDVQLYAAGVRAAYRFDGSVALLADAGVRHVERRRPIRPHLAAGRCLSCGWLRAGRWAKAGRR